MFSFAIKAAIAIFVFAVVITVETIVYENEKNSLFSANPKLALRLQGFGFWVTKDIIDWGFGSYPSYICILFYGSFLGQRKRSYMHICLYCASLFMAYLLQICFSQPHYFSMFPQVYNGMTPYSCRGRFGLPSSHSLIGSALIGFCIIDHAYHCMENEGRLTISI